MSTRTLVPHSPFFPGGFPSRRDCLFLLDFGEADLHRRIASEELHADRHGDRDHFRRDDPEDRREEEREPHVFAARGSDTVPDDPACAGDLGGRRLNARHHDGHAR